MLSEMAGSIQREPCWPCFSWNLMRAASTPYLKKWLLVMMLPVEAVGELAGGLAVALLGGALLARAVGVEDHAERRGCRPRPPRHRWTRPSTRVAPRGCRSPRRGSASRSAESRSPSNSSSKSGSPHWSPATIALVAPLPSLGRRHPRPIPPGARTPRGPRRPARPCRPPPRTPPFFDSSTASSPSSMGSNVAATTPVASSLDAGSAPGLHDGRQDRDVDRLVGAAEELEVGERCGRGEHEDDDRDDQLGCSGQEGDPLGWPPPGTGHAIGRADGEETRPRENPASLAQGPRVGFKPGGPAGCRSRRAPWRAVTRPVSVDRLSRRARPPRDRPWPAPRA